LKISWKVPEAGIVKIVAFQQCSERALKTLLSEGVENANAGFDSHRRQSKTRRRSILMFFLIRMNGFEKPFSVYKIRLCA
jgi:hypothetical protein